MPFGVTHVIQGMGDNTKDNTPQDRIEGVVVDTFCQNSHMCFWEVARDRLGLELSFTLVTMRRELYPCQPHALYLYNGDDNHTYLIRLFQRFSETVFMKNLA